MEVNHHTSVRERPTGYGPTYPHHLWPPSAFRGCPSVRLQAPQDGKGWAAARELWCVHLTHECILCSPDRNPIPHPATMTPPANRQCHSHQTKEVKQQPQSYKTTNSQQQWFPALNSVISRLIAPRAPANYQHPAKSLIKKHPSHIYYFQWLRLTGMTLPVSY